MPLNRRKFITAAGLAALINPTWAQMPQPSWPTSGRAGEPGGPSGPGGPLAKAIPPNQIIALWPGKPPGGEAAPPATTQLTWPTEPGRDITIPMIGVYRPDNPDGSGLIVFPGGGYMMLSLGGEGSGVANRFNADRITAFVLAYRIPGEGWSNRANVPLQDAQRSIRIVRSRAAELGVDPKRIGVMGFSAGGHLAATLATCHAERVYDPIDSADAQLAKPAFAGLIYPVITFKSPYAHAGSRDDLLGPNASEALIASRSVDLRVTSDTAPCFMAHGIEDTLVPVENSLMMLTALREKKIKCEAHIFQEGRHGFGTGIEGQSNEHWPEMFIKWMRINAPA